MERNVSQNFIEFDDLSPEELRAFNKIVNSIHQKRGIDFRQYRPKCLRRRIVVSMHDVEIYNFCDFVEFLSRNPQHYDRLLDRITINVSEFFRNPKTFEAIRQKVIPEIIKKKNTGGGISNIRIWSAGCATGEEPYTLAILFKETLEALNLNMRLTIIATDIDKEAIKRAKVGFYRERALKELSPQQRDAYFEKDNNTYLIKKEIKDMITFRQHNMIDDIPPKAIDLILCRNVIIYFSKELQKKVYLNFHKALAPSGFLVAGKTETFMHVKEELFTRIDAGERILRKTAGKSSVD